MIFEVEMRAFHAPGTIRKVDVPDEELTTPQFIEEILERVFYWGQNDFQPVEYICSVSVGDVIRVKDKRDKIEKYKVDGVGYIRVEDTPNSMKEWEENWNRRDR